MGWWPGGESRMNSWPKRHGFRSLLAVLTALTIMVLWVQNASAQKKKEDDEIEFEPDDTSKPAPKKEEPKKEEPKPDAGDAGGDTGGDDMLNPDDLDKDPMATGKDGKPTKLKKLGDSRVSWQDIVVVIRKPFLKINRIELLPQWGITMNDNIIQHVQFNGQLNYWLTDVLAVGVEGHLYVKNLREPFDLVARQARRLPTVNKYNWGGALNFHYVPIYGKFAVLDKHLIHWESFFTAGVGVTQSEVLPRDPALQPFKNILITPNVGAAMRFFLTKFLTVHVGIRDYVFVDKFEAVGRTEVSGDAAKDNASSALINNVVFQAGLSFWFPTSFKYTTFR
jgi:outer membrane beta-barrel protein